MSEITPSRMALILHRATSAYLGPDTVGDAPQVTGDNRMPGEFLITTAATGRRFRVTVTSLREDEDE